LDSLEAGEPGAKHHIPSFSDCAAAAPEFQSWILRFRNLTERHYFVNVFGDCDPAKLGDAFARIGRLAKEAR
jgi:hypothetical protein